MSYKEQIEELISKVSKTLVDLDIPREKGSKPSQATSNFVINREQGDWAENIILQAFNATSKHYVAVKYGKSEDRVAGEEGFNEFYQEFQVELDTIGKRPDLLIFNKGNYNPNWNYDISRLPPEELYPVVSNAIAGIEIRSSAYLTEKYDDFIKRRNKILIENALFLKKELLNEFNDELEKKPGWIEILNSINENTIGNIKFKSPGWRGSERIKQANEKIKALNEILKVFKKRDFLSVTVKQEDIKTVYKWIDTYNIPHFYFQVFFDKIYGLSFEQILTTLGNPELEDATYYVEENTKNQQKTTIHISYKSGTEIASKVDFPNHKSRLKELDRGRLLFYVTFEGGVAYLDVKNLMTILGITENEL
jgi:type II restriction enzyme